MGINVCCSYFPWVVALSKSLCLVQFFNGDLLLTLWYVNKNNEQVLLNDRNQSLTNSEITIYLSKCCQRERESFLKCIQRVVSSSVTHLVSLVKSFFTMPLIHSTNKHWFFCKSLALNIRLEIILVIICVCFEKYINKL